MHMFMCMCILYLKYQLEAEKSKVPGMVVETEHDDTEETMVSSTCTVHCIFGVCVNVCTCVNCPQGVGATELTLEGVSGVGSEMERIHIAEKNKAMAAKLKVCVHILLPSVTCICTMFVNMTNHSMRCLERQGKATQTTERQSNTA